MMRLICSTWLAVLRLVADDDVEALLAVDDLRGHLAADRGLDHVLHVGDIEAVAGDLVAVDLDIDVGLAQLLEYAEVLDPFHLPTSSP